MAYQIRKIAGCACAGNAGNVFLHRRLQRKLLVSDPYMHHDTCVTHVPWCMSGSLNQRWQGKRSRHSRRMRARNFTYLVWGPSRPISSSLNMWGPDQNGWYFADGIFKCILLNEKLLFFSIIAFQVCSRVIYWQHCSGNIIGVSF